jgi:hypothetical protein
VQLIWARTFGIDTVAAKGVLFACAASAGAHAGLAPSHLESEPRIGGAFVLAVLLLLGAGVLSALRPADVRVARAAALLFAGLISAYITSRTTGIPLLQSDSEPLDAVGVATNVVEALGLACALLLTQPSQRHRARLVSSEVSR